MAQVTLQDIATIAGVSAVTVHRVLTRKGSVSPKTAETVRKIAKDLGYEVKSDTTSQSNVTSEPCFKTHSIGLLLVERPREILNCTINTNLLSEIEANLAKYGLLLTIIQVSDSNTLPATISKERLDGVILLGAPYSESLYKQLEELNPVGLLSLSYGEHYSIDWVTSDYEARGRLAVNYLINNGHKKIAYINIQKGHQGFHITGESLQIEANRKGIVAHILESGDIDHWKKDRNQRDDAMDNIIEQMQSLPSDLQPTALFVGNDEMAVNLYKSLRKRNIEPMRDIEILSCDNDETYLSQISPRPATIDLNLEIIAQNVVERLLFRIRHPEAVKGILTFVPPSIIPAQ